jgi:hypothetical protein
MRRIATVAPLVAAVVLTLAASANAAAHVQLPVRPPLPTPMPQIIRGACPGLPDAAGCNVPIGDEDATGRVYATGAVFTTGYRFTTMHELGHAFDATRMDDGERARFGTLVDHPDEFWSSTYTDEQGRLIQSPDSLAEIFADAYANCRLRRVVAPGHLWEAGYGYFPTARQHRQVCKLIARAGLDAGTPATSAS